MTIVQSREFVLKVLRVKRLRYQPAGWGSLLEECRLAAAGTRRLRDASFIIIGHRGGQFL
jgi:hypothetical protein